MNILYNFTRLTNEIKSFYSCLRAGERASNYPNVILVELTSRCNLNCRICIKQRITKKAGRDMSFETFKRITQDLLPFLSKVTLAGFGEPLLNRDIYRIVNYAHGQRVRTSLITNGTLLTAEAGQNLIDSGLDKISISLDSASEERYSEFRGWELGKVLMNIKCLKALTNNSPRDKRSALKILVNNTMMAENIEEIPQMVRLAYDLGVDGIEFGPVDEVDLDFKGNYFLNCDKNKLDNFLKEGIRVDNNNISNLRLLRKGLMFSSAYNVSGQKACYSPWGYMLIMADGEVMPCCRPFNYYLGKLNGGNFQEVWNGLRYRDFRNSLISGENCNRCILNVKLNNLKTYTVIKKICRYLPFMKRLSRRSFY